jgi:dihydrodipicolinate synthase/N-acetylneuraminate lyase
VDRANTAWRGYWTAVTTTFERGGALDELGWRELLRWMSAEGMHGLAIAGTTGEWFSLSPRERVRLFEIAADEVGGRIPLIGGCSAFTPGEAIEYAKAASGAGLHGILLTPPPYVVPSDDEILAFFRTVHDAVEIPIVVYNWPTGTGVDLSVEVLQRLAELPRIVALKNSTPRLEHFIEVLAELKHRLRIFGVLPSAAGIGLLRHVGGDGVIGAGGVLGRDHPAFYEAIWRGDLAEAHRLATREQKTIREWLSPGYKGRLGHATATFKAALRLRGLPGGYPRSPLLPLSEAGIAAVRRTLTELGIISPS